MGRIPCCEKDNVKRGQWTPEEDNKLSSYIAQHGTRNWRLIPKNAGLQRCGKSCRLRWTNYLRPDLKHGDFSEPEEQTIVKLHSVVGNRWSLIAAQLPGRTDNDVKNHWNTKLKKKLSGMGIDPVTHKPFSHLMAEIATTLAPPQVAHLAEAALGCFKDEMLHLLTKRRVDLTAAGSSPSPAPSRDAVAPPAYININPMNLADGKGDTAHKIKLGLSRAMLQEPEDPSVHPPLGKPWTTLLGSSHGETPDHGQADGLCNYAAGVDGFGYGGTTSYCNYDGGEVHVWSQSLCTGSTCTGELLPADKQVGGGEMQERSDDGEDGEEAHQVTTKECEGIFGTEYSLWDLADDLILQ